MADRSQSPSVVPAAVVLRRDLDVAAPPNARCGHVLNLRVRKEHLAAHHREVKLRRGAIHRDIVSHIRRLDRPAEHPLAGPTLGRLQPHRACRPGQSRHHDRETTTLWTVRRLAFDPRPLLRPLDPSPAGERMSVRLLADQIRQRHHPERDDIPHHTIDPFREVPARVLRVILPAMAMAFRVPNTG